MGKENVIVYLPVIILVKLPGKTFYERKDNNSTTRIDKHENNHNHLSDTSKTTPTFKKHGQKYSQDFQNNRENIISFIKTHQKTITISLLYLRGEISGRQK